MCILKIEYAVIKQLEMSCTFTFRKTARFHKRRHSNSLSLPVTLSCVVVLKSIMKHFINVIYTNDIWNTDPRKPFLTLILHIWGYIHQCHQALTQIQAESCGLLWMSWKIRPKNTRRVTDHWKKNRNMIWYYDFLYMHYLHTDSHSEVFEVPQSPPLRTYINRQSSDYMFVLNIWVFLLLSAAFSVNFWLESVTFPPISRTARESHVPYQHIVKELEGIIIIPGNHLRKMEIIWKYIHFQSLHLYIAQSVLYLFYCHAISRTVSEDTTSKY